MTEQAFMEAFAPSEPMEVEYLDKSRKIANVTDGDVTLLVTGYYCAHCAANRHRDNGSDGEAWCRHKEAAFGDTKYREWHQEYEEHTREMAERHAERMGA